MRLIDKIGKIWREEEAATAVEYSLLLAMMMLGVLAVIGTAGSLSGRMWNGIVGDLQDVGFIN